MGTSDALVMFVIGYLMIVLVILLISYVLTSLGNMKVFAKAGEAGWKGWIPILCDYTVYKISWQGKFFWIALLLSAVQSALSVSDQTVLALLSFAAFVGTVAIRFMQCSRLAKAFGKGTGFAIGLFFLPPIFMLILGFGSAQYQGIQE